MEKSELPECPFELRVHLHGMRPEDALEVVLPPEYTQLSIGELLESVFPDDEESRARVERSLDLRENPDLPEIYAVLFDVLNEWRLGRCAIRLFSDHCPDIKLSDPVVKGLEPRSCGPPDLSDCPILSLVMEQEYLVLDHAVEEGYWEEKAKLIEWLQSLTLLYFLDKHEFQLSATPSTEVDRRLLTIAESLRARQIIFPSEATGNFHITEHGRQLIGGQIAETESYIDRYDIFKDVDYDVDAGRMEYDSGRGEDLRVQVFIAEGLDPVRVVFLLRLYDGSVDQFVSSWRQRIHDKKFYDEILEPAMNYHRVDEGLLQRIIENGFAHIDEQEEEDRESLSRQQILRRVGPIQRL